MNEGLRILQKKEEKAGKTNPPPFIDIELKVQTRGLPS